MPTGPNRSHPPTRQPFRRAPRPASHTAAPKLHRACTRTLEPLESRCLLSATFSSAIDYDAGAMPDFIASCDFNGDSKRDLVSSSYNGSSVSVLLGNGDGTFGSPTTIALTDAPDFVTAADLNADGKMDLVTASFESNAVSVLLGNGDGTFGTECDYAAGTGPRAVVIADFNGDARPDIAVAKSFQNELTILINNGDGTFAAPATTALSFTPSDLVTCDFNGDGKQDLAAADFFSDRVAVMLGNGNGTFGSATMYSVGQGPTSLVMGDFNGDGKSDLASANFYDGTVTVLSNNGSGAFGSAQTLTAGAGATFVATADIDLDGNLDLVCANANADSITVFSGNFDGTFQLGATFDTGASPRALVLAKFNAGNVLDVAVSNQGGTTVSVMLGAAATPPTAAAAGPYHVSEGGSIGLNGLGSSGTGLTYLWDLDGDGIYGETGAAAKRGEEIGATPTFSAATIDGPDSRTIRLQVIDSNHLRSIATATVFIDNVAPTLTLSGDSSVVRDGSYVLNLSSADPGSDTISQWVIHWGDGSSQTVAGNPSSVSKIYSVAGTYTITASATDEDGTYNAGNSLGISVTADMTAPTASLTSAPPLVRGGGSTYDFAVQYSDDAALDAGSFDNADIYVTGPNSFTQMAQFVSASGSGSVQTVTYRIVAPGGSWDVADNGAYGLTLQLHQVRDASGNFAAKQALGGFQVGVLPPDTAGNTLDTAANMGTVGIGVARAAVDGVGILDRNDFFKFTLNTDASVYAKLYNMTDNADLMLMDSVGKRIAYSKTPGSAAEAYIKPLTKGTYYVRVINAGIAGTAYRLRFEGVASSSSSSTGGDTLATATFIGKLFPGAVRSVSGTLSTDSPDNFFRLKVTQSTVASLKLYGLSDNADLELLDRSGAVVARSARSGTTYEFIQADLVVGYYYAHVSFAGASSADYSLRIAG